MTLKMTSPWDNPSSAHNDDVVWPRVKPSKQLSYLTVDVQTNLRQQLAQLRSMQSFSNISN